MKLYVWNEPYHIDYGSCCLYVIAENVEQARELANSKVTDGSYGGFDRKNLRDTTVDVTGKDPTSIHELPYAEIYHWSE